MTLDLHLKIVGLLMFGIIVLNFFVWKKYQWSTELMKVSLLTRQVFTVHTFYIMLTVGLFGTLSLVFTRELLMPSALARLVLAALVVFWSSRLVIQWCVYDTKLWRGQRMETFVHFFFTGVWGYFTAVYGTALWWQMK